MMYLYLILALLLPLTSFAHDLHPKNPAPFITSDTDTAGATRIFYVCDTDGNDGNDGLSPGNAWKTIDKVQGSSFSPGDYILFCRGDSWDKTNDGTRIVDASGTAANRILMGCYTRSGTSGGAYPEIIHRWNNDFNARNYKTVECIHMRGRGVHGDVQQPPCAGDCVTNTVLHRLLIKDATGITIRHAHISGMCRAGIHIDAGTTGTSDIILRHNKIEKSGQCSNGLTKNDSGYNGEGVYVGNDPVDPSDDVVDNVIIENNDISATTDEAVNIKRNTRNIVTKCNYIHDVESSDPAGGINSKSDNPETNRHECNIIEDIKRHPDAGSAAGIGMRVPAGSTVLKNTVFDTGSYWLQIRRSGASGSDPNNLITLTGNVNGKNGNVGINVID